MPTTAPQQRERGNLGLITMAPAGFVISPTRAGALGSLLTATDDHYVLAHHGIAHCSDDTWTLTLDGLVNRELRLTMAQLRALPRHDVTAFLECTGNPGDPDKPTRIISNARWGGVSLAALLREAGVSPHARYVWMRGEDWGTFAGVDNEAYIRDIPVAKAMEEDVIVAYELNGEPLTAAHGFPLRVLVPGYYGTNSVKWVSAISAQADRPEGLFTQIYTMPLGGHVAPARGVLVNSCIWTPRDGQALATGVSCDIRGWAWADEPVVRVEVSTSDGESWIPAALESRESGRGWQAFRVAWTPETTGPHSLLARATDASGRVQPHALHINQMARVQVTTERTRSSP